MNVYLYLDRDTVVHRMDPRAKLLALLAAFTIAFLFSSPLANLVVLVAELLVVTLARAWPNIRRVAGLLVVIAIMTTIMFSLVTPGTTPLVGFIKQEAVLHGIAVGLRLDALIIAGLIFLSTTSNEEITIALVRLGVPYRFGFAVSTALRLVPTIIGTAQVISQAQKCRGNDIDSGNVVSRISKYAPIVIPVFVSTIRSTQVFSMALESKGFGARDSRTYLLDPRLGRRDVLGTALAVIAVALGVWLRFNGIGMAPGGM